MKIETLPNYHVAYVRQVGPYGPANIQAMERLKKWAREHNLIESAIIGELAGGNYAVFKIRHTAEDIQKAWTEIFPVLHSRGYQIVNKPIVERYSWDMVNKDYCKICVPIKL